MEKERPKKEQKIFSQKRSVKIRNEVRDLISRYRKIYHRPSGMGTNPSPYYGVLCSSDLEGLLYYI